MSKRIIEEVVSASPNRRKFLQTLGVATAAVYRHGRHRHTGCGSAIQWPHRH